MYQQQKVNIPISSGGVTVKNISGTGYVYYTTSRVYSSEEKRSNPIRVTIGKQCTDDPTRMFPNEKYAIYFADTMPEELLVDPKRSSCFNYAITATQRKKLKAFDLTPANIKEQAKLLAAELKNIDEKETKKAAVQ